MNGLNSVTLGGNLTRDPELRYTQGGTAVLSMSVAVNESRKDGNGEWTDYPNYIDMTLFGKRAESVSDYLSKGTYVAVTGRLHQNRWEKDGQKRSKVEVVVDNIHFQSSGQKTHAEQPKDAGVYDEDIPF
jgi:single-strand DNA-binding protein